MADAQDALQSLIDERDITAVYHRYCDIIDAREYDRLGEVYTDDCQRNYTQPDGSIEVRDPGSHEGGQQGLAPLIARLKRSIWFRTHHNVLNFRISTDGDSARARVHYYAVHQIVPAGEIMSLWGEYDDDLIRTPDGWRISERRYSTWLREGDWDNRPYRDAEAADN